MSPSTDFQSCRDVYLGTRTSTKQRGCVLFTNTTTLCQRWDLYLQAVDHGHNTGPAMEF